MSSSSVRWAYQKSMEKTQTTAQKLNLLAAHKATKLLPTQRISSNDLWWKSKYKYFLKGQIIKIMLLKTVPLQLIRVMN